jgi:hypothetical protein
MSQRWSWSELLSEHGGDEEAALTALRDCAGWGSYEDDVHRPYGQRLTPADLEKERERKRDSARRARGALGPCVVCGSTHSNRAIQPDGQIRCVRLADRRDPCRRHLLRAAAR